YRFDYRKAFISFEARSATLTIAPSPASRRPFCIRQAEVYFTRSIKNIACITQLFLSSFSAS
ncbi:TPA: hypothetical protein ACGPKN_004456, partial [Enterobacter hormaechei]